MRAVRRPKEGLVKNQRKMRMPIQDVILFVTSLGTPDRSILVGYPTTLSARGQGRTEAETQAVGRPSAMCVTIEIRKELVSIGVAFLCNNFHFSLA